MIMRSFLTLAIHTVLFFSFSIGSIVCTYLLLAHPEILAGKTVVIAFTVIAFLVLGAWFVDGGPCPFTVWENNFRKKEGKRPYKDACINHYARGWFGMKLPERAHTWLPLGFLILPIVVGIMSW
ncbi:MAG TPA: DUF2784 family protein [Candidatus Paceibacterota bacterium]